MEPAMLRLALIAICVLAPAALADGPRERFIPVALWTGSPWDGKHEIRMSKVDFRFGKNDDKRIHGPIPYTRPGTGEVLQVYERDNKGKIQLFAVTANKDGLGRVYDSRYDRNCVNEVKFPLGLWREGETRRFTFTCVKRTRTVVLKILQIDFIDNGVEHAMSYRWTVDGGGKPGTDNVYTYAPGHGLLSVHMQ
jgi:hypothetical protein